MAMLLLQGHIQISKLIFPYKRVEFNIKYTFFPGKQVTMRTGQQTPKPLQKVLQYIREPKTIIHLITATCMCLW